MNVSEVSGKGAGHAPNATPKLQDGHRLGFKALADVLRVVEDVFCYVLLARLKEGVRFPFLAAGVDVVRCVLPRSAVPNRGASSLAVS